MCTSSVELNVPVLLHFLRHACNFYYHMTICYYRSRESNIDDHYRIKFVGQNQAKRQLNNKIQIDIEKLIDVHIQFLK